MNESAGLVEDAPPGNLRPAGDPHAASRPVAGARILIVNENESVPGDRRVWDISTTLAAWGADVVVICPFDDERGGPAFERRDGVEIHRFTPGFAEGGMLGYVSEYGRAFACIWQLARRLVRERPFDVVHACNPPDFLLFAARPAHRGGARLIFDHHDLAPELFLSRFGGRRRLLHRLTLILERLSFRAADVVLATNDSYRDVALERGGKAPEDVFVVPNAPDLRRLRQVEPDPALRRGQPLLIGYLGVMAAQDGVEHALNALAKLRETRQDWHAVFGGEGPERRNLVALADQLGLSASVEFAGWLGDAEIARLLSTADVCLAPEPKTPFNDVSTMVKVAEYMAMARPIVSFDLRQTRRIAGEAAAYAQDNDPVSMAAQIDELLDDPERRARMGETGRARVQATMTWERSVVALEEAYARALLQPPATR